MAMERNEDARAQAKHRRGVKTTLDAISAQVEEIAAAQARLDQLVRAAIVTKAIQPAPLEKSDGDRRRRA
jgi:hypothetical protein